MELTISEKTVMIGRKAGYLAQKELAQRIGRKKILFLSLFLFIPA